MIQQNIEPNFITEPHQISYWSIKISHQISCWVYGYDLSKYRTKFHTFYYNGSSLWNRKVNPILLRLHFITLRFTHKWHLVKKTKEKRCCEWKESWKWSTSLVQCVWFYHSDWTCVILTDSITVHLPWVLVITQMVKKYSDFIEQKDLFSC
jgi:hypothetical protein